MLLLLAFDAAEWLARVGRGAGEVLGEVRTRGCARMERQVRNAGIQSSSLIASSIARIRGGSLSGVGTIFRNASSSPLRTLARYACSRSVAVRIPWARSRARAAGRTSAPGASSPDRGQQWM